MILILFLSFLFLDNDLTMIVIGESGAGKSSLCNVIVGESHDADLFPASKNSMLRTQRTTIRSSNFKTDVKRPITLVDTQGFNDPGVSGSSSKVKDQEIITELMKSLTSIRHINLFVIAINGTNLRLNASLLDMLRIFEDIFGHTMVNGVVTKDPNTFWSKCRIVLTNLAMDKKSVKRRTGSYDLAADKLSLQTQLNALKNTFDIEVPPHLIIDSLYDNEDDNEVTAFEDATEQLYNSLVKMSPAMTTAMLIQYDKLMNHETKLAKLVIKGRLPGKINFIHFWYHISK